MDIRGEWKEPILTAQQKAKCELLEITIFLSGYEGTFGKYCIGRTGSGVHLRPIKIERPEHKYMFVWSDTIEGCFLIAADPAKYGGEWKS